MGCINTCDICKRTARELPILAEINHFKMKKETYSWHERSWERIDICSECEREIRFKVQQAKEEK